MFTPIDGGSEVDIQGLPCQLPPVGYIYDYTTSGTPKLKKIGVHKRNHLFDECFWEIDKRWGKYLDWQKEETRQQSYNKSYYHADLKNFIDECWIYRLGGFWFYNKDVPTYITGQHWFYLSCYHLPEGLPSYRDADRKLFYAWQYCVEDPKCYGLLYLTMRRGGKTFTGGNISIEFTTRQMNFNSGIQSKTDKDAKDVFRKAIIQPYRKIPYFFRPAKSNMENNGKVAAKELRFVSNKSAEIDDELASMIDYGSSNEVEYDGKRLGYYLADEVGKPQQCDINQRWNIVKYCLRDHTGKIIGKTLHTTTVEDIDGVSGGILKMWKGSDQLNKVNGRTETGMYRYFVPADEFLGLNEELGVDIRFGIPDREAATQVILQERESLKNDPRSLSEIIRKTPLNIKEAFQSDSESCAFNPIKLNEREDFLRWLPKQMYEIGNFHWVDDIEDGEVEFRPNPNGKFKVMYLPPEQMRNMGSNRNGKFYPGNSATFAAGVDPFDHKWVEKSNERRMSDGALVILKKSTPLIESVVDGGPACIYLSRPAPEIFYEDVIKCLKYYGCEAMIEINKPGLLYHMESRGYGAYAAKLPDKDKPGISATEKSNIFLGSITDTFINQYIETVFFPELIEDWKRFDVSNTTEFDIAMAFGYALMLVHHTQHKFQKKEVKDVTSIFSFMKRNKRA